MAPGDVMKDPISREIVVVISADAEWKSVCKRCQYEAVEKSAYGEWFQTDVQISTRRKSVIFFHGGWGKIAAAASTQYLIDKTRPTSPLKNAV